MLRNKVTAGFGIVTILAAGLLLWATTAFEGEPADRLFPQILLGLLLLLGAVLTVSELSIFKGRPEAVDEYRFGMRQTIAVAASLAYPIVAFELGFYTTTFVFLLIVPIVFIRTEEAARSVDRVLAPVWASLVYAALVTTFLYASFERLLKFSLPAGAVF